MQTHFEERIFTMKNEITYTEHNGLYYHATCNVFFHTLW